MSSRLGVILADFETQLASAMAPGATSVTIQSATDDDGVALPNGQYFFALDGNNSQKEHILCTLTGTSLTNIYSVSRQGVQTSGVIRSHRIGSSVSLTDFAHLRYINDLVSGATAFDHTMPLGYDGTASITAANQLATKAYVDGVAIAGAPDASDTVIGITKLTVAAASPTNPLAVGDNDPRVPTANQAAALAGDNGSPSSSNKYLTQTSATAGSLVPFVVPTGAVLPYAASSAPTGYLLCNGAAVSRTTYGTLFALISTTYGIGDGTTTFNVPDMRANVPAGYKSGDANFGTLGGAVGEAAHTLTNNEMPAHTHPGTYNSTAGGGGGSLTASATSALTPVTSAVPSQGGGAAHNTIQPSLTLQFIIKT